MTVSSTQNRKSYAGNGVTTAFSFPYYFLVDSDLVVLSVNDTTGVSTTLTLTTDYTVTGAGDAAGGTVNTLVAPATGVTLIIYRDPAKTQLTDFVNNDDLDAATLESAFDRLTMVVQRQDDIIARSMRFQDSDPSASIDNIPNSVTRANQTLIFGADGKPTAGSITTDTINAAMSDVVNAASHAAARELLLAGMTGDVEADGSGNLRRKTLVTVQNNNVTLAPADRGQLHRSGAASKTWTLPAASSDLEGWQIEIGDAAGGTIIASPAADLYVNGSAAAASYTFAQGEWGTLKSFGASGYVLNTNRIAASTSVTGDVKLATTAQMTTGTSPTLVPSVAAVAGAKMTCKAWARFTGLASAVLTDGYNVASVTYSSTGKYVVTFTNTMANANYSIAVGLYRSGGSNIIHCLNAAPGTGSFAINTFNLAGAFTDADIVMVQVFGT